MNERHHELVALGRHLRAHGYAFTTVTPRTHATVLARPTATAPDLRAIFGWNRAFDPNRIAPELGALMQAADVLAIAPDGSARSKVRFATLGTRLFLHSAFPTNEKDAVFFGPDTYRFCAAIARLAPKSTRAVDVGCGCGVGGITLADRGGKVVLADVSARALDFARVNLALAGLDHLEVVESDVLSGVEGDIDLVVANPPYMSDDGDRTYRDGGGDYGEALAVRIAHEALDRLAPGGTLLLYTGTPVVGGEDVVMRSLSPVLARRGAVVMTEELDPDVFGEELEKPRYREVERIAAIVVTVTLR